MTKPPDGGLVTTKDEAGHLLDAAAEQEVAYLPREFGCSGTTAWRRLRDWQAAGAVRAPAQNAV